MGKIGSSFTLLALVSVIGMTACASGGTQPLGPQDGADSKSSAAESGPKDRNFQDPLKARTVTFPASWQGGAGWWATTGPTAKAVFSVGNYTGYVETFVPDSGMSPSPDTNSGQGALVVVDGSGSRVYVSKQQTAFSVQGSSLSRISRNGKGYLVYIENGVSQGDPTSVAADKATIASSVTVIDESGTVRFSKVLGPSESVFVGEDKAYQRGSRGGESDINAVKDDSVRVSTTVKTGSSTYSVTKSQVMNIENGALSPEPTLAGAKWVGNYDGVDLFRGVNGLTDGKWTAGVPGRVEKFGSLIQIVGWDHSDIYSAAPTSMCRVLNLHSGEPVTNLGVPDKECLKIAVSSQNGNYVAYSKYGSRDGGILNIAEDKVFPIVSAINFRPRGINNSGDVYGVSDDSVAYFNMDEEESPKIEVGVNAAPYVIADSGLAAFSDDEEGTYFVVKQ
ncbi:hypothetical protein [Arthrobacter sp. UYEF21]|uniref:hypothetical protein n=1 Tax=Arthrobacter sp. UYEF21 TaxID=1756364 RepID=UPI00339209F9